MEQHHKAMIGYIAGVNSSIKYPAPYPLSGINQMGSCCFEETHTNQLTVNVMKLGRYSQ